jgi:hypothetical protein
MLEEEEEEEEGEGEEDEEEGEEEEDEEEGEEGEENLREKAKVLSLRQALQQRIHLLLQTGCNPSILDDDGHSAADYATELKLWKERNAILDHQIVVGT